MSPRRGLTLIEVLVALMIFMFISTALVGSLLMATRLFREGEMARATNDEAMSIIALVNADIENAVSGAQGGDFLAMVVRGGADCVVGWSIRNSDPLTAHGEPLRFVLWGRDSNGTLRRWEAPSLQQIRDDHGTSLNNGSWDPRAVLLANGQVVTNNCRFFSVWCAGTRQAGSADRFSLVVPTSSDWSELDSADNTLTGSAEPVVGQPPYGTAHVGTQFAYPSTLRFLFLMDGKGGMTKRGIVTGNYANNATAIRVAGLQGIPTAVGSVLLVERVDAAGNVLLDGSGNLLQEIIGYHGLLGGELVVNTDPSHGPLDPATGLGRGVHRTQAMPLQRGDRVSSCRAFTLVRVLPR